MTTTTATRPATTTQRVAPQRQDELERHDVLLDGARIGSVTREGMPCRGGHWSVHRGGALRRGYLKRAHAVDALEREHAEAQAKLDAANALETAEYVIEPLYTDTRCWQVIARTAHTMTLRAMQDAPGAVAQLDERCDHGDGLGVYETVQAPDENGRTVVVRRRADNSWRIGDGHKLRATTTPARRVDRRF